MSDPHEEQSPAPASEHAHPEPDLAPHGPLGGLVVRGGIGGVLMGLANLVPGISGGTMLLASGVYQPFINAIAEVSTLRLRPRSLVLLGSVVVAAGLSIVLLAGPVKDLVVHQRWIMYSLFIGLTLGGVPLIWSMIGEAHRDRQAKVPASVTGAMLGIGAMAAMVFFKTSGGGSTNFGLLLLAGLAGASAMILPGLSGGYLLLVLGQYVPILASIDRMKDAIGARDFGAALAEWVVVVPVGLGVVLGIAGVSNLLRFMLKRFEGFTLGVLMGLLLGSVLGLWPFQEGVQPVIGSVIKGEVVTEETIQTIAAEDWPLQIFAPTVMQVVWSVVLIGLGLATTLGIAVLGNRLKKD
jgi:putative membrane protein